MDIKNQAILEAFKFRHACKHFDATRVVSEEDFSTILEAGRLSPSSFGFEPWKFLVIQNRELKNKLWDNAWGAQNSFKGASHFVIFLARKKPDTIYSSEYITHIMADVQQLPRDTVEQRRKAFENFQKKSFALLESDRAIFDWACKQTYIAMANMITTAALLKIDSCPIEGFNRAEVDGVLENEGILDTEHYGVSVMASFGYRAEEPYAKTRQSLASIVQWI